MKEISEMPQKDVDILSSLWTNKWQKGRTGQAIYEYKLKKLLKGEDNIENFPVFIALAIKQLGYSVNCF